MSQHPNLPSFPSPSPANDAVQAIIAELERLLLEELNVFDDANRLDPHAPLLDSGLGLDSITLFELITLVEKRYEITFPAESLNSEAFASLSVMARHVQSMVDQRCTAKAIS